MQKFQPLYVFVLRFTEIIDDVLLYFTRESTTVIGVNNFILIASICFKCPKFLLQLIFLILVEKI